MAASPGIPEMNAAALARYPSLLEQWLPGGHLHGVEYTCGNLSGGPGSSCKVNIHSGLWSDFATGESGGDPVSLFAAVRGLKPREALRELAETLHVPDRMPEPGRKAKPRAWTPILPVPSEAPHPPLKHPRHGKPGATWTYRDSAGNVLGHVCRFDSQDGEKDILPITYCRGPEGRAEWRWQGFPEPRPLYGLDCLARLKPDAGVLLVEGEKTADAATALRGPDKVCMTWPGGSKAVGKVDLGPLKGRPVGIWPDADKPGFEAALALAERLKDVGASSVHIILPSDGVKRGWDPADAKTEGWTPDRVAAWIQANSKTPEEFQVEAERRYGIRRKEPTSSATTASKPGALSLVCAADVEPEPVSWIWPGHVAACVVHVVDGVPGVGKSMFSCYLGGVITTGTAWPDGTRATAGNVIIVNVEDDLARTLSPRLKAAGADMERVFMFDDSGDGFTLPGDLDRLEAAIVQHEARLVVIDPFMAVLDGKVNAYKDQDVRRVLAALKALCGRTGCAVVLVRHPTKMAGGPAIHRGSGSIGIIGAARIGMLLALDPKNDSRRILATVKNNLGPSDPKSSTAWTIAPGPRLEYAGPADISADELLHEQDQKRGRGRPGQKLQEAQEWAQEVLSEGPMPSGEFYARAEAEGHSERTMRRACAGLVESSKRNGEWHVRLAPGKQHGQNSIYADFWPSSTDVAVNMQEMHENQDGQKSGCRNSANIPDRVVL